MTLERTLEGVVQGRLGVIEDIRETPVNEYADAYDEQARDELTAYSKESGGASSLGERFDIELERKEITREEIQEWMEEEGSKEWDRLDMSAMEYMRYYNSGMCQGGENLQRASRVHSSSEVRLVLATDPHPATTMADMPGLPPTFRSWKPMPGKMQRPHPMSKRVGRSALGFFPVLKSAAQQGSSQGDLKSMCMRSPWGSLPLHPQLTVLSPP